MAHTFNLLPRKPPAHWFVATTTSHFPKEASAFPTTHTIPEPSDAISLHLMLAAESGLRQENEIAFHLQ